MLPPLIALACAPAPAPQVAPDGRLDPVAHAARASLVLRGVRPSAEESARVRKDPEALDALVAEWVESPLFLETVRDVHAQAWWLRSDTRADPPSAGPLLLTGSSEIEAAFQEEPLRLVSEIVADGRPYTDVVTAEHTMIDAILVNSSIALGLIGLCVTQPLRRQLYHTHVHTAILVHSAHTDSINTIGFHGSLVYLIFEFYRSNLCDLLI